MTNLSKNIVYFLILLIPVSLVVGPAVADITISLAGFFFLVYTIINRDFGYYKNKYFIIFIFLNLYFIFLSLISENIYLSLESSLFYFRFGFLVLAIYFILNEQSNLIYFFLFVCLITTIVISIDAFIQLFYGENLIKIPARFEDDYIYNKLDENFIGRISGAFGRELILGSFLIRLMPLILGLILFVYFDNKKIKNLIIPIFIILMGITIFISGERTAFAMFLLSIFLLLIFLDKIRLQVLLSGLLILLMILLLVTFDKNARHRMIDYTLKQISQNNIDSDLNNLNFFTIQHEVIYKTSIKIYLDNKIFGIGPKMFREICKKEKYHTYTSLDGSINGCQSHPHNTYIQILTETGLLGFLIILFIFIYLMINLFRNTIYKSPSDNFRCLEICASITLIVNLWPLMPTGNFFNNWLSILYYLPVGFFLYAQKHNH